MAKGQKKTGGRQKDSRNKRTQERLEHAAEVIEAVGAVNPGRLCR